MTEYMIRVCLMQFADQWGHCMKISKYSDKDKAGIVICDLRKKTQNEKQHSK